MENSPAVGVFDSARYLRHQLHTLSRFARTSRLRVVQASARREFHTEKRKAVLAFAYLIYRKDVRMIQAGYCFGFTSEAHQRLM